MQASRMAAAYALISILTATGGVIVLWPSLGWWSLASVWPVGSVSCLIAAVIVAALRLNRDHDDLDELADDLVADLRGVLANSRRPSVEDDQAIEKPQRYGTAG